MDKDISKFFEEKTCIKNSRPCTSEQDIKATIALNQKMQKAQSEFRSRSAMSRMAVENFVFTT